MHPKKPGLGNRVGKTESWYVFLLICLLNTAPPPGNYSGKSVDTEAWVPTIYQVMCAWRVLPVALFWFGFIFLWTCEKGEEGEGRVKRLVYKGVGVG